MKTKLFPFAIWLFSSIAPLGAQTCTAPPTGLVGWWPGDGHYFDLVGTNHGAPSGDVSFATGKVGSSFSFDGLSQFVRIPNLASLNPPANFSIEAWVYPTRSANQIIFAKWGDAGDYDNQRSYNLMLTDNNAVQFAISDAANQQNGAFHVFNTPTNAIALNVWTHVVAVYDQSTGTRRIYVNGVAKAERTDAPITVLNGSATAGLGAYLRQSTVAAAFFQGQIDEVSFYQRGLSSNEVVAIHTVGSAGKCKPPLPVTAGRISWWPGEDSAEDIVGPNSATSFGNAGYASGLVSRAFDLDGINGYLQVPSPLGLPLGSQSRTLMLWFKTPRDLVANTDSALAQYGSPVNEQMFGLITSGNAPGKLYFFGYNRDLAGTNQLIKNVWYHAAATYDGTTVTLYLNGQPEGSRAVTLNTVLNPDGLTIGYRPGGAKWEGQLDEVMLFNRALAPNEVAAIYAAGTNSIVPPPTLAVSFVSGGVQLSWPASAEGYALVSRPDLAPGNWETVTNAPALNGSRKEVLVPAATASQRFFRLLAQ